MEMPCEELGGLEEFVFYHHPFVVAKIELIDALLHISGAVSIDAWEGGMRTEAYSTGGGGKVAETGGGDEEGNLERRTGSLPLRDVCA